MAETKTVNLEVNSNIAQTEQAVTSLRSELRKAQADVAAMSDKFGATSREAVEASKRAADLKDRIGDAKSLTDAFNPDAKFKALSSSLNGVAGGFAAYQGAMGLVGVESKDLEKQLLKVQSAMAIAQGLQTLGEARDSFKQLKAVAVDALKGIKTEILATGIGAFVVAAGTIYAYWDDIKAAVSGVSTEQRKLNAESKKNLTQEEEKLKAISNQDEVLKLQGKSEREILKMKIAQTNETIADAKIDLERIKTTNEQQQKGIELNYKYLKSFIDFISIPQRLVFETYAKTINKVIDLINKIPIPGLKIDAKIDEKFADKAADYVAKLGFDPEKTRIQGENTVKEAQLKLDNLANDRAGYQNKINDIDKQAGADAAKIAEDNAKALEESRKRSREDDEAIRNEIQQAISDSLDKQSEFLVSAQEAEEQKVKDKYFRLIEYAKQFGIDSKELEIAKENELNEIRLKAQEKQKQDQKAIDDKQIADAKAVADAKVAIQLQGLNALGDLVGLAKSIGEKNKGLQKAALIAESAIGISKIVINTQAANSAARLKYSLLPGGAALAAAEILLNKVSAGIGIAANIAATAKGLTALGGGGAGGGGGADNSAGGGGGAAPQFNVVGNSGVNQLAETMQGRSAQAPIQAYVVAQNVTTAQSLNRNIVSNASLG